MKAETKLFWTFTLKTFLFGIPVFLFIDYILFGEFKPLFWLFVNGLTSMFTSYFTVGYHIQKLKKLGIWEANPHPDKPVYSKIIYSDLSLTEIREQLDKPPYYKGLIIKFIGDRLCVKIKASEYSYAGEMLTIESIDVNTYRINSRSRFWAPIPPLDYGKNFENVQKLITIISKREATMQKIKAIQAAAFE